MLKNDPAEGEYLLRLIDPAPEAGRSLETEKPNLSSYDYFIVAFSGGKDSLACLLHLFDCGILPEQIELWHHDIDGQEGSHLMDWPCTRAYCQAVADAFGVKIYFSWKEGGFEREMLRDDQPTSRTFFETPEGLMVVGGKGPNGTRLKFPQVSADLRVRWCSAYLKIDVADKALANQSRFLGKRVLILTGERAQESASRAKYKEFEPHRVDPRNARKKKPSSTKSRKQRHVDQWRPVHSWSEERVWEIIKRWRVIPHPAYRLGWGRVSCAACIFGSPNQWASLRVVSPGQFNNVAAFEHSFGKTIKRKDTVIETANKGTPYEAITWDLIDEAHDASWSRPVIVDNWQLPAGAYGESAGPT